MDTLNTFYNSKLIFDGSNMSDYEASIQFNHQKVDQTTLVCQKDGIDLYLCGCVTIMTPEGLFLAGGMAMGIIFTEVNATKAEFIAFLQGENNEKFKGYEVTSNPWFEWQERGGDTVGDVFDTIPADIATLSTDAP
tara:strand:+ start:1706 stop:2113 length:408 start_codon:yes stop_codon:yes gene_type:complete